MVSIKEEKARRVEERSIREEVLVRLRNIRGHLTGIERMVEEGKECPDILIQLAAVRAALEKTTTLVVQNYARTCYQQMLKEGKDPAQVMMEVVERILKVI